MMTLFKIWFVLCCVVVVARELWTFPWVTCNAWYDKLLCGAVCVMGGVAMAAFFNLLLFALWWMLCTM